MDFRSLGPWLEPLRIFCHPRWLSGLTRSLFHSLMIARRSLCPEKLGSNPGQGSKGINFSGWHGLDMSIYNSYIFIYNSLVLLGPGRHKQCAKSGINNIISQHHFSIDQLGVIIEMISPQDQIITTNKIMLEEQ